MSFSIIPNMKNFYVQIGGDFDDDYDNKLFFIWTFVPMRYLRNIIYLDKHNFFFQN